MLTKNDIDKLADLARIDLTEEEKTKLQKDMESILGYISELQKAPNLTESHQPNNYYLRNVMRSDEESFEPGANTEKILEEAPKQRDNLFVVKKILDNQ
ncbi:MAG: Asp-tRNA(Asn)/Glu-tRNA(Gln) amidotransferase subunit GatC [Candidatus Paceibacterota bacterium]|jgi:aspartyl-tRNA(Asn)/glutamyl-tRNA(Gln) amidotransferase subunit C